MPCSTCPLIFPSGRPGWGQPQPVPELLCAGGDGAVALSLQLLGRASGELLIVDAPGQALAARPVRVLPHGRAVTLLSAAGRCVLLAAKFIERQSPVRAPHEQRRGRARAGGDLARIGVHYALDDLIGAGPDATRQVARASLTSSGRRLRVLKT